MRSVAFLVRLASRNNNLIDSGAVKVAAENTQGGRRGRREARRAPLLGGIVCLCCKKAKRYGTWGSQVIPQPSTSQAQPRLTSEF